MIINDAHVHLFKSNFTDKQDKNNVYKTVTFSPNPITNFKKVMKREGIQNCLVFPFPNKKGLTVGNDYVVDACTKNTSFHCGILATADSKATYLEAHLDIIKCVKEHFLVRYSFPSPTEFELMQDNNIPFITHQHSNEIITRINYLTRNYKKLKVIIAHSGRTIPWKGDGVDEVASNFIKNENVYFDTSTIRNNGTVSDLYRKVGGSRIIFGSDYPFNTERSLPEDIHTHELISITWSKIKNIDKDKILRTNFEDLFMNK